MTARLNGVIIDCPDPESLAPFYETLLGARRTRSSAEWVTLELGVGQPTLSLQRVDRYRAPDWRAAEPPQQIHLDLLVDNLDVSEAVVISSGGRLLDGSDKPIGFRVYADPVGHPFCLVTPEGIG